MITQKRAKGMKNKEVVGQLGTYGRGGICTQVFCPKNPVMEKCKRSKVTIVSPGQLGKVTRVSAVIQEQASWQYSDTKVSIFFIETERRGRGL